MIRGINKAYAISAVGHGVVLLWSVLSFAAKPLPTPPSEALPVDIVSVSEFTQMTAGNKDAPKVEAQKPLVEKVAEAKAVEDPTAKVVEKKEVKAAREAPPPVPETKPAEPEKKVAEVKPDQVAEALAKDEAKPPPPEPKKAEAKPPTPTKKPAPPAPKFDPKKVEALLDKRDSTRLAAAGDTLNSATSLGASSGASSQISLSELDALRAAPCAALDPAGGSQGSAGARGRVSDQAAPRWPDGPRAVAATGGERQHPARDRRPRKRRTCAQPRPTFRHAQARTL